MINLIAPRIALAEHAARFLRLKRGEWRFIVEQRDIQGKTANDGLFVWVNAPRYPKTLQDDERHDYIAQYIKESHIETLEYTLP